MTRRPRDCGRGAGLTIGVALGALVGAFGSSSVARAEGPPPISREALAQAARSAGGVEVGDGVAGDGVTGNGTDAGKNPGALPGVDVEEKLGATVPADLWFTDDTGARVRLGDLLAGDTPTLLILAYYRCPVLCGALLRGVSTAVSQLGWKPGEKFRVVTVSIDPNDTWDGAGKKKENVQSLFETPADASAWPFLVGGQAEIDALTDAVGFRYVYDARIDQYVHPAVAVVLGPNGLVSRYVYGVEPRPLDLRLALLEAGEGKVGTAFERFILSCYRYDPVSRKYVNWTFRFIRVGAFGIVLAVGLLLSRMWRRERQGGRP